MPDTGDSISCYHSFNGTVTDQDNNTLPGVTVRQKGTSNGTVTDGKGYYNINVPLDSTLVFTSIGMEKKEVVVKKATLNVSMQTSANVLNQVVIAGAVFDRKRLSGAVDSISSKQIEATPTADINEALQGRLPGALVTSSAQPGSGASIRVRGYNSIQYGTNPIFVVDGVIMDGSFNMLNPDDIASVEVLKDAAATAIYGSRGANGVVIVTTKKGKSNKGEISYNAWVGRQTFSKKLDLMNADFCLTITFNFSIHLYFCTDAEWGFENSCACATSFIDSLS